MSLVNQVAQQVSARETRDTTMQEGGKYFVLMHPDDVLRMCDEHFPGQYYLRIFNDNMEVEPEIYGARVVETNAVAPGAWKVVG